MTNPERRCAYERCDREKTAIRPDGCDCEPFPRLCAEHRRQHTADHAKLARWVQL